METKDTITKNGYSFKRSTYNPDLDHMMGKVYFKEKHKAVEEFLKAHPIPKELLEKMQGKSNYQVNDNRMPHSNRVRHFCYTLEIIYYP
jgi:hypothetical protein